MSFEMTPLGHSDLDLYINLRYTTFSNSDASFNNCFFPNGWNPDIHAFMRKGPEKNLDNPDNLAILIRDPVTKEVLGGANWEYQREPKSTEAILEEEERSRQQRAAEARFDGIDYECLEEFRTSQAQCHREIMGERPHAYLHVLVVSPQHQRRGVGAAAMKWGLDKADELGLPAYLEASLPGKGLYERYGFKTVKVFPFDALKHGNKHEAKHYCMLREARKTDVTV